MPPNIESLTGSYNPFCWSCSGSAQRVGGDWPQRRGKLLKEDIRDYEIPTSYLAGGGGEGGGGGGWQGS